MKYGIKIMCALVVLLSSWSLWAAPIDINTADAAAIAQAMVGIGDKKAADIVAYRKANGPFKSIEELANVKGVGQKMIENNRENIFVAAQQ